jgi:hypothetical protein
MIAPCLRALDDPLRKFGRALRRLRVRDGPVIQPAHTLFSNVSMSMKAPFVAVFCWTRAWKKGE